MSGTAALCASAIGDEPLVYRWYFLGSSPTNGPVVLATFTNSCLTMNNVQLENAGYYVVSVSNAYGSISSAPALISVSPVCVDLQLYAGLNVSGGILGQMYKVQSATNPADTNWMTLTTITQSVSGVFWFDPQPATKPLKIYRVLP